MADPGFDNEGVTLSKLPFVNFYTLNLVRNISLKLQEVSTIDVVGR